MDTRRIDAVFSSASIAFNVLVSALYLATKFGDMQLVQTIGVVIVSLAIPFAITFIGYLKGGEKRKTLISNAIILFYLFLEVLLDYVLRIPFRDMLAIHIPYIVVLYAALFSMMATSYEKNRKTGVVVIATFFLLMACLAYYLSPL